MSQYKINLLAQSLVPKAVYQQASVSEQNAFTKALVTYFVNIYSGALHSYNDQVIQVKVYPARTGNQSQVNTVIQHEDGSTSTIQYSMILQANQQWMLTDFIVDNVDAVAYVQQQIQTTLQSNSHSTLSDLTQMIQKHNSQSNTTTKTLPHNRGHLNH